MDDIGPIFADEASVPDYALPPLLGDAVGRPISEEAQWNAHRSQLLQAFRTHVYGHVPAMSVDVHVDRVEDVPTALDGRARRRQARVTLSVGERSLVLELLLYLPRGVSRPVPVFLALNFFGNHSVHADPCIRLPRAWLPDAPEHGVVDHRATEAGRGCRASYWAIERTVERGYGLATVYCGDIDPDYDDGFRNGAHGLLPSRAEREPDAWGTIAAWAWGLSRVLDALSLDSDIDSARVAVIGHSRLGKTALWAGAQDSRFVLVISNNSGCGGAALFRRRFGETIRAITTRFPHWFAPAFRAFADREDQLPVDQHQLLALVAPRPLYVASASEDLWADPRGEFLAARDASPAWALYGHAGLARETFPEPGECFHAGRVGYHLRAGGHAVTSEDWEHFLDFADRHL